MEPVEHFDVIIVGAGLSGIGAAYRIHEKNSLKIRKARYGGQVDTSGPKGKWVAGAAAAASVALWAAPNVDRSDAAVPPVEKDLISQNDAPSLAPTPAKPQAAKKEKGEKHGASAQPPTPPDLLPPHS